MRSGNERGNVLVRVRDPFGSLVEACAVGVDNCCRREEKVASRGQLRGGSRDGSSDGIKWYRTVLVRYMTVIGSGSNGY